MCRTTSPLDAVFPAALHQSTAAWQLTGLYTHSLTTPSNTIVQQWIRAVCVRVCTCLRVVCVYVCVFSLYAHNLVGSGLRLLLLLLVPPPPPPLYLIYNQKNNNKKRKQKQKQKTKTKTKNENKKQQVPSLLKPILV